MGPEGVALFGQFMSFANILAVVAGGGIAMGVIKYVAEYSQTKTLKPFLSTATIYTLFFSFFCMGQGFYVRESLSLWIFGSNEYAYLIAWIAVTQFFITFHLLLCAIINGLGQIRLLVKITLFNSILSLVFVGTAALYFDLKHTLLAFVWGQAGAVLISLCFVYKKEWLSYLFSLTLSKKYLTNLFRYSLMTTISALALPVAQLAVRNDLGLSYGWDTVGYWQAVLRLSDTYLVFVTTALNAYYLPRLSQLSTVEELKREIRGAYKSLMPIIGFVLVMIFLCRGFIINFLYSQSFAPAAPLFSYQLLGDFFRLAGWLFTYLLLAKAWTKTYIFTEILLGVLFFSLSHFLSQRYGIIGVTYAFSLTYIVYWALMASLVSIYFKQDEKRAALASI